MIKVAGNNVLVDRTRIKACLELGLGSKVEVKDVLKTIKIEAGKARNMTEEDLMDLVWMAQDNSIIEINASDPDSSLGDNDGVYLEIIKLDDEESVVRDRWSNQDGDRHIVKTRDIYAIYRALVDQVEEVA